MQSLAIQLCRLYNRDLIHFDDLTELLLKPLNKLRKPFVRLDLRRDHRGSYRSFCRKAINGAIQEPEPGRWHRQHIPITEPVKGHYAAEEESEVD